MNGLSALRGYSRSYISSTRTLSRCSPFSANALSSRYVSNTSTTNRTHAESKLRKYIRRTLYLTLGIGSIYALDSQFNASSLTRTARTFFVGCIIATDYKINFRAHPPLASSIEELHERNAGRIFDLLCNNGGLYLKIGQAIAMQSAILPPEFQKKFAKMFDDAPQNDWKDVEKVIREEYSGRSSDELFESIEKRARASASVAQVHWARLHDGREVAVKIQKREIAQQVKWDLWAFKYVYMFIRIFKKNTE